MGCYACLGHDVSLRAAYASRAEWRRAVREFEEGSSSYWPPEVTKELQEQEEPQPQESDSEREEEITRKAEEIANERAKRWLINGVIVALLIVGASMCARSEGNNNPYAPDCQWVGRSEQCW